MGTDTTITILYVDDDQDEMLMLKKSISDTGTPASLVYAPGGEEALHYLNSLSRHSLPELIILDLNMPRWDGRKTLNSIKSNPGFASIPVVIFSTSGNSFDRQSCLEMGAASYIKKPFLYSDYKDVISSFLPLVKIA